MSEKELERRITQMEKRLESLQLLQDAEDIKKLQRAYGYYLEHWMAEEVIDCFSDSPDAVLSLYEGTWQGKESIRRYFARDWEVTAEFLHQVMQLSPIIDVEPDGTRAGGRWYSWGACAMPAGEGMRQYYMGGIYEVEYIKEDGRWKILKLAYNLQLVVPPGEGWVRPERLAKIEPGGRHTYDGPVPDIAPHGIETRYPSGYIFPFHYRHPVTGKETSEAVRNASIKYVPTMFSEEARNRE